MGLPPPSGRGPLTGGALTPGPRRWSGRASASTSTSPSGGQAPFDHAQPAPRCQLQRSPLQRTLSLVALSRVNVTSLPILSQGYGTFFAVCHTRQCAAESAGRHLPSTNSGEVPGDGRLRRAQHSDDVAHTHISRRTCTMRRPSGPRTRDLRAAAEGIAPTKARSRRNLAHLIRR